MNHPIMRPSSGHPVSRSVEGFSLIEVVLAIGVVSFCLVAVLGLLPVGLKSNKDSSNQTTAAGLAMAIASDLKATPASPGATSTITTTNYGLRIPSPGSNAITNTLYLSEDGTTNSSASDFKSSYLATVTITPPASGMVTATAARILITWPPVASPTNASSFESVIYLNRN